MVVEVEVWVSCVRDGFSRAVFSVSVEAVLAVDLLCVVVKGLNDGGEGVNVVSVCLVCAVKMADLGVLGWYSSSVYYLHRKVHNTTHL